MKNAIAGLLTALTVLSIFGSPALAASKLSGYPSFLLSNGELNAYVVVGQAAQTSDVVGAIDVAVRLGSEQSSSTTGGTVTTVSGGKSEDMLPGEGVNTAFGNSLDYSDLAGFQKGTLTVDIGGNSNDYNIRDEIDFTAATALNTGLTVPNPHEDFGTDVFLNASSGSIIYLYKFDDSLKAGNLLANATSDEPITISFLGKDLVITSASAASNSVTVQVGEEHTLQVGESVTVNGKKVTLENVGSGASPSSILVDVDGVKQSVSGTKTVNGLQIKVKSTFYSDVLSERVATLVIGTQATKTYTDGDEFIGEDKSNPNWKWDLAGLDTGTPTIGVKWAQTLSAPEDNPPKVGQCLWLPTTWKFASICVDHLASTDYLDYTARATTEDLYPTGASSALLASNVILLESTTSANDAFTVGGQKTDAVALNLTAPNGPVGVFWKDHNDGNKFKQAGTVAIGATDTALVKMNFRDAKPQLDIAFPGPGANPNVTVTVEGTNGPGLAMYFQNSTATGFQWVGHSQGDTTKANDIKYGTLDISGFKKDTRTADGLIVKDPDGNSPADRYKLSLPGKFGSDFKATVIVSGPGTSSTSTSSGGKIVVPVKSAIAKLDTEVASMPVSGRPNLVVIGGPAVNSMAAALLGVPYPTTGVASTIPENAAWLQVFDGSANSTVVPTGKVAVLCAGWEADNTRVCTSVLQQYDTLLSGQTASAVKITSASSAGITPA